MIPYEVSMKYLIAGYSIIFTVLAIYLASLIIRWRNLKRDLQTLEEMQQK